MSATLAPDLSHVFSENPLFDFSEALLASIDCDLDYLSPPPSPISLPASLPFLDIPDGASPQKPSELSPEASSNSSAKISSLPSENTLQPTPLVPSPSNENSICQPPLFFSAPRSIKPNSTTEKKTSKKPEHRKARLNAAKKAWRKKRREEERDAVDSHYQARSNARLKYVKPAESIECQWDASDASVASSSFVALDDGCASKKEYTLEELVGDRSKFKFRRIEWNGRTPTAIVDSKKRIVGIMAGHPEDKRWPALHSEAAEAPEACRKRCYTPQARRKHRRGAFTALNCGVSHGGGQSKPGNLKNCSPNSEILEELNNLEPFKRLAGFSSSVMATWSPGMHEYYTKTINAVHAHDPSLQRIFPSCVYCGATYNLGPRTVCCRHKDRGNLAFGSCSVTALGEFDPTTGGHLILWDLHLVIEFPPGSTIIIPSAIIAHSNVKVAKHERRYSFALYTAGALFRWVENNCMAQNDYLASLSPQELETAQARALARWNFGLSLLPTYPTAEIAKAAENAKIAKEASPKC